MAVKYANFLDISINDYDVVVVGCGFAGAVCARQLAEQGGKRVLVLEKRAQIAGNMYDERDEAGILVHKYGPHIFHTNNVRVFNYLRRFSGFIAYKHKVLSNWYGTYIPVPFNLTSLEMCFEAQRAQELEQKLVDTFGAGARVTINELRAQKDPDLAEIADFVYKNVFLYYTQKQWGLSPDEVDPSVTARVPVLISHEEGYFQDSCQGMPVFGYTKLFEEMLGLENITVCLNTEAESVFDLHFASLDEDAPLSDIFIKDHAFKGPIIYTGPLDEMFLSRFGRLPYRSLRFEYETLDQEYFQPCGTVNYTVTEDFTRITEFKYLTGQKAPNTTIMREYSLPYEDSQNQIPYYAIINDENQAHYERYLKLTETLPNFYPLGRLAEYRYYNMDVIVERALNLSDEILGKQA